MKFSVLLPVYYKDDPKKLDEVLDSIKWNTRPPQQIVIVVDGPVGNNLEDIILKHDNANTKVVWLEKNEGIINALNVGLHYCNFEFVARCDADDINKYDRFEKQLDSFARDKNLSICGGQILELATNHQQYKIVPCSDKEIKKFAKFRNPFNHMTVMYKKSEVLELGGYPNILFREDYALWAMFIGSQKKLINLDAVLVEASAGMSMYERRGKPRDIKYEYRLQKLLLCTHVINRFEFCRNIGIRGANMLVPAFLRGLVYKTFLRKSAK